MADERPNRRPISVNVTARKAERYYALLNDPNEPEYEAAQDDLEKLISDLMDCPAGDADDFHNFSIALSRHELTYLACDVLRCGLRQFPKDCDLLGDFLQCGMKCGLREECAAYYETLSKIPKRRYTWRSFSFSIYYLEGCLDECETDRDIDALAAKMLKLSDEFLKYMPYDEEAYRSRATIYKAIKNPAEEIYTLRAGLRNLSSAPRCALQLADILVDRGEYKEAMDVISRGISDNNKDQSFINEAYMYYLLGRAKLGDAEKSQEPLSEDVVMEVYLNFNIALSTMKNRSYKEVIYDKVRMLKSKTGIGVPERFENLYDLVEE